MLVLKPPRLATKFVEENIWFFVEAIEHKYTKINQTIFCTAVE